MISGVHLALFDLGNTLFYDDAEAWPRIYARAESALWRSLRRAGVTALPADVYGAPGTLLENYYALRGSGTSEPGTFHVLKQLLAPHAPAVSDTAITSALRALYKVTQTNWRVERGAAAVLRLLQRRGLRIGAISNGSYDWNALELLNRAGLRKFFEFVLTSDAHGSRKPDPSIFTAALDYFKVRPDLSVMIGDSYEADILGAQAVGMHSVWITRRVPVGAVEATAPPDEILRDLREIPSLLG